MPMQRDLFFIVGLMILLMLVPVVIEMAPAQEPVKVLDGIEIVSVCTSPAPMSVDTKVIIQVKTPSGVLPVTMTATACSTLGTPTGLRKE